MRTFIGEQGWWLDDCALFRAAHHVTGGRPWTEWPAGMRDREQAAVAAFRRESGQEILFRQYLQWIAHEQWLKARHQSPGLRVSGDFPFGVAADSADVWANQDLFSFDGSVGAPPDAFSEGGQNWQLPVYRWDVMRERGYAWFGARARRASDLFDLVRVDHVVGLFRSWISRATAVGRTSSPRMNGHRSRRAKPCFARSSAEAPGSSPRISAPSRTSCVTRSANWACPATE